MTAPQQEELSRLVNALDLIQGHLAKQAEYSAALASVVAASAEKLKQSAPADTSTIAESIRGILSNSAPLLNLEATRVQLSETQARLSAQEDERKNLIEATLLAAVITGVLFGIGAFGFAANSGDAKWQAFVILGLAFYWVVLVIVCLHLAFRRPDE